MKPWCEPRQAVPSPRPLSRALPEPMRARDMVGESSLWAGTVR